MLSVKVGGTWLSTMAPYGPVTVEYGIHGSEAASWTMNAAYRHPLLRGNQLVEVYDGGLCIWFGTLVEPGSTGEYSAIGAWRQAQTAPAMNAAGVLTAIPNDAIAGSNSRGEISWGYDLSISGATWAAVNPDGSLADLLSGYAGEVGLRWTVSANRIITMQADPTVPQWHVPHAVAGRGLTPAEDEFATHLVGTYTTGASTFTTETVGSAAAATAFGRRTKWVDLTAMGTITAPRANSVLTGMFLLAGARMGWAEGLELSRGQITTPGGTPAPLEQIRNGQMVRLAGVVDTSRANLMPAYTDVVIGTSKYTDGSDTIQLTPIGYADRNLADVLKAAVA